MRATNPGVWGSVEIGLSRPRGRPFDLHKSRDLTLYCGICHSDIHNVRSEWRPSTYPCIPGHEIIGRVQAVGSAVARFKVGDVGGVGCMVGSCGTCENCLADREQNCLNGAVFTYCSRDPVTGEDTLGGYSDKMVVPERFVPAHPAGR